MSEREHRAQELVDGELSARQAAAFCRHLCTCRQCRDELEDALQLALLARDVPAPDGPHGVAGGGAGGGPGDPHGLVARRAHLLAAPDRLAPAPWAS